MRSDADGTVMIYDGSSLDPIGFIGATLKYTEDEVLQFVADSELNPDYWPYLEHSMRIENWNPEAPWRQRECDRFFAPKVTWARENGKLPWPEFELEGVAV